jgi:serine phosphatase RsbU (regulator of sigma subunit)
MRWQSKRGARFWKATSVRLRVIFAVAVFFMSGAMGVLVDVAQPAHTPLWTFALYVALVGVVGVAYVLATLLDLRLIPAAVALHVGVSTFAHWATATARVSVLAPAEQHTRLVLDVVAILSFVVISYSLFMRFMHAVVRGHARLQAEMTLAKGIHEALVPSVSGRSGDADYYGRSHASGVMGGDLVDVFEGPQGTTFYLVDVSGHGVGAGVLMAMLKSASRAALAGGATLPVLLRDLNRTVHELGRPGTFATCACLQVSPSGQAHYALAGHLPILHRHAGSGEVSELVVGGPLLGFEAEARYESVVVEHAAGDAFLLLSDGLTEIFHRDGNEFGMDGVRSAAFANGVIALKETADRVFASAARYGQQLDDQTVLLVRVNS